MNYKTIKQNRVLALQKQHKTSIHIIKDLMPEAEAELICQARLAFARGDTKVCCFSTNWSQILDHYNRLPKSLQKECDIFKALRVQYPQLKFRFEMIKNRDRNPYLRTRVLHPFMFWCA